jgi:hypothetical protein
MNADYERWLISKQTVFSPSAAAIAKLVARLRKEGWLPASGHAVRTIENTFGDDLRAKIAASREPLPKELTGDWIDNPSREELRLVWPVDAASASSLTYPLTRKPDGAVTYALEIHRAPDFVYPIADGIDAIDTTCPCGDDLAFEWDEEELVPAFRGSSGIYTECEACSRVFDPSKHAATIANPFGGASESVRGGAAYRFALKIDCGKCYVADPSLAFAPELVAIVEDEFGRSFYQVGATF